MLEKLTEAKHQTKTAVIVSALRLYAQSLTAVNTSPAEISPAQSNRQPAGAETAPATETSTTTTETPEEISPGAEDTSASAAPSAHSKPTETTTSPAEGRKASKADYISVSAGTPERAAESATEARQASPEPSPEEISPQAPHSYTADDIRKAAAQAYRAGVQQARQEIRAAATKANRARHTASRAKIQAKRRPRVFKG